VPKADEADFQNFLSQLGYPHWDESKHPAYQLFLGCQESPQGE
jgi:threonine dehydratase